MIFNFIQFLQDIADYTVGPLGADIKANLENNRVRTMNNRELYEEQKPNSRDRPSRKKEREEFKETF